MFKQSNTTYCYLPVELEDSHKYLLLITNLISPPLLSLDEADAKEAFKHGRGLHGFFRLQQLNL